MAVSEICAFFRHYRSRNRSTVAAVFWLKRRFQDLTSSLGFCCTRRADVIQIVGLRFLSPFSIKIRRPRHEESHQPPPQLSLLSLNNPV